MTVFLMSESLIVLAQIFLTGKTGKVRDTNHFDMYGGGKCWPCYMNPPCTNLSDETVDEFYFGFFSEVKPLITFLNSIEVGSIVLIASFDEPATKYDLNIKQKKKDKTVN